MYDSTTSANEFNLRNAVALGLVGLVALAVAVVFSPAIGLYELGPQKQVAASIR
jgi:hypothetical protein